MLNKFGRTIFKSSQLILLFLVATLFSSAEEPGIAVEIPKPIYQPGIQIIYEATSESSQTITTNVDEKLFNEETHHEQTFRSSVVSILAVQDEHPSKISLEIKEAWKEAGIDSAPVSRKEFNNHTYHSTKGLKGVKISRADGTPIIKSEFKRYRSLAGHFLGQGDMHGEQALFLVLDGMKLAPGDRIEIPHNVAKIIFVGATPDEAPEWTILNAEIVLDDIQETDVNRVGLFSFQAEFRRMTRSPIMGMKMTGRLLISLETGFWVGMNSHYEILAVTSSKHEGKQVDVIIKGTVSESTSWNATKLPAGKGAESMAQP